MRAEELILQVWTQRKQLILGGKRPSGVVLSKQSYDAIQEYHRGLGFLPEGVEDYITKYTLFELPFFLDENEECRVSIEGEGGARSGSALSATAHAADRPASRSGSSSSPAAGCRTASQA